MKKIILIMVLGLLVSQEMVAQKYFTRTGKTDFKASVDTFEPVEATNNSSTAILQTETGNVAAQLFITAFKFRVALMQEHFNENYMDSHEYPKATFKGKLEDFSTQNLEEKREFTLSGTLTVKGKKKEISTLAQVHKVKDKIKVTASFSVQAEDFGITIPKVVRKKIADKINITIDYELVEKK